MAQQDLDLNDKKTLFNIILSLTDKGLINWNTCHDKHTTELSGIRFTLTRTDIDLFCLGTSCLITSIPLSIDSHTAIINVIMRKEREEHTRCLTELMNLFTEHHCGDTGDHHDDDDDHGGGDVNHRDECIDIIRARKAELEQELANLGNNGNARRELQAKIDEDQYLIERLLQP